MARPKRQEERRRGLVRAASHAIAERGYSGVRIKDVADAAGLSSQAVLYYYPDIDELLLEAIHFAVRRYVDWRRELVDALDDPVAQLEATIRAGSTDPEHESSILYQCVGAVRSNMALRTMTTTLTNQQVDLYQRILEVGASSGAFHLAGDSRMIAENLVALEDGYGLWTIEGHGPPAEKAIAQMMAFAGLATGVDLRADGEAEATTAQPQGEGHVSDAE